MSAALDITLTNLLSPMILFFALGVCAAAVKSDLAIPDSISKAISLYLMLAIGFTGGTELSHAGLDLTILVALLTAALLSFAMPIVAFMLLRRLSRLGRVDAAATAAHYGSVSVVTFGAATAFLAANGATYEGYLVAMLAVMETPAIISGLFLAGRSSGAIISATESGTKGTIREVLFSGSVVLIVGAFIIGFATGKSGLAVMAPVIQEPFKAVLAIFLLDMGLLVGHRLRDFKAMGPSLIAFGLYMPLVGAAIGLGAALALGLSPGGSTLFAVLAASASYIVVPAAMRHALPEANPAIYLTLSACITFPFNLTIGIPIYYAVAHAFVGG